MINASTFEKLKALNCSTTADEFQNQLNDSKSYNALGFEERLDFLWTQNGIDVNQTSCIFCFYRLH